MPVWQALYFLLAAAHWSTVFALAQRDMPGETRFNLFFSGVIAAFWPVYSAWLLADAYWQEFK